MNKNPYVNALLAAGYIAILVLIINYFRFEELKETIFIPMTMLSLLVLSVSVMGFLFAYRPLTLYLDNKKEEALVFFGKTVGTFAGCLLVFVALLLYTGLN